MKILFFCSFFVSLLFSSPEIAGQTQRRNLLQLKYNVNYFKGYEIETWRNFPTPNIAFTRFSEDRQFFWSAEVDELNIFYTGAFEEKGPGTIMDKNSIVLELKGGYNFMIAPKRSILAKLGLACRFGWETQFLYNLHHQNWIEQFSERYRYENPGIEASIDYLFYLGDRWSLVIGAGYQYFVSRITTNHHLRANAGMGYAF